MVLCCVMQMNVAIIQFSSTAEGAVHEMASSSPKILGADLSLRMRRNLLQR